MLLGRRDPRIGRAENNQTVVAHLIRVLDFLDQVVHLDVFPEMLFWRLDPLFEKDPIELGLGIVGIRVSLFHARKPIDARHDYWIDDFYSHLCSPGAYL